MHQSPTLKSAKPTLRGYFHQEAFFMALGACSMLIAKSSNHISFWASAVYSFSLLFLFGVSALYHRPHWEVRARELIQRFDHSAIFILIAGSFTPFCLLGMSPQTGHFLLSTIWLIAAAGTIQAIFWVSAPKWILALLYISMGWVFTPYASEISNRIGSSYFWLLVSGGILYSVGAIFYAAQRPNFKPGVFGYHELFHFLTVIAAILHFIAINHLIT